MLPIKFYHKFRSCKCWRLMSFWRYKRNFEHRNCRKWKCKILSRRFEFVKKSRTQRHFDFLRRRTDLATAFTQTEFQRCIVHQVWNTLKYVAIKKKNFAADLKKIYTAQEKVSTRPTGNWIVSVVFSPNDNALFFRTPTAGMNLQMWRLFVADDKNICKNVT